jgi:hypothetical protein
MKVVNQNQKKIIEVRNLKNITFKNFPKHEFFVHKSLCGGGFSVTEKSSGACLIWEEDTIKEAIIVAETILNAMSKASIGLAIKAAVKRRKEIEKTEKKIISMKRKIK